MLYLTRKIGESIIINNNIEVSIVEVTGKNVKVGLKFPKDTSVLRKELHDKIKEQNLIASKSSLPDEEIFDAIHDIEPHEQ